MDSPQRISAKYTRETHYVTRDLPSALEFALLEACIFVSLSAVRYACCAFAARRTADVFACIVLRACGGYAHVRGSLVALTVCVLSRRIRVSFAVRKVCCVVAAFTEAGRRVGRLCTTWRRMSVLLLSPSDARVGEGVAIAGAAFNQYITIMCLPADVFGLENGAPGV